MNEYKDGYVEELEEEIKALKERIESLDRSNNTMLHLIQLNDQKQALIEASPEFAEAVLKIEQN
jgi:uncharacterized membrane protein (DUF106 family)